MELPRSYRDGAGWKRADRAFWRGAALVASRVGRDTVVSLPH
ncbi:hypothetical protein thalar_01099 [Litoreibacter arenae DSM 19593]|uniref:Uncharacterized protein n=1 Tax=Litoreibacter arenae DSM 19593 TaxID=1123360 RepID=S9QM91_9RHOB|nr:hypothetical protein thalar_01099 [Litoreibacter arenae DSM 19593]